MYKAIPLKTKLMVRQLHKDGLSYREISDIMRVSTGAISDIVAHDASVDSDEDLREMAQAIKRVLASKYLVLADAMLESVTKDEVEESSLKDMAITAAILTDKAAMLDPSVLNPDLDLAGPEVDTDELPHLEHGEIEAPEVALLTGPEGQADVNTKQEAEQAEIEG